MKSLDQINVTLAEFFARNSQVTKGQLADMLGVSSGVITRMSKQGMTRIQALAVEALNSRIAEENTIHVSVTEWVNQGSSYFSGVVTYKGQSYFMRLQYGYGSLSEHVAVEGLQARGLVPNVVSRFDLSTKFNHRVKWNKTEVNRKSDLITNSDKLEEL